MERENSQEIQFNNNEDDSQFWENISNNISSQRKSQFRNISLESDQSASSQSGKSDEEFSENSIIHDDDYVTIDRNQSSLGLTNTISNNISDYRPLFQHSHWDISADLHPQQSSTNPSTKITLEQSIPHKTSTQPITIIVQIQSRFSSQIQNQSNISLSSETLKYQYDDRKQSANDRLFTDMVSQTNKKKSKKTVQIKFKIPNQNPIKQDETEISSDKNFQNRKIQREQMNQFIQALFLNKNHTTALTQIIQKLNKQKEKRKIDLEHLSQIKKIVLQFQKEKVLSIKDLSKLSLSKLNQPLKKTKKKKETLQQSTGLKFMVQDGNNFPQMIQINKNGYEKKIFDEDFIALAKNGHKFPVLQVIRLWNNNITDKGLKALVKNADKFQSLKMINLSINQTTDEGLKMLAENGDKFPNLQTIDLASNQITGIGLKVLIENSNKFARLQTIDFAFNKITGAGLKRLTRDQFTFQSLQTLDLAYNQVKDDGLKILVEHGHKFPSLTTFIVSTNKVTDEGLKALVENGYNFSKLQIINYNRNQITDEGLKTLVENGGKFPLLKRINLFNNKITDTGMKALVNNSQKFPNLQIIDLWNNQVSDDGFKLMVENGHKLLSLQAIGLSYNKITGKGLKNLLKDWSQVKQLISKNQSTVPDIEENTNLHNFQQAEVFQPGIHLRQSIQISSNKQSQKLESVIKIQQEKEIKNSKRFKMISGVELMIYRNQSNQGFTVDF